MVNQSLTFVFFVVRYDFSDRYQSLLTATLPSNIS